MVETKTYNCTICGLTFSRKYHLARHTETKKHIDKVQNIATTKTHCCTFCNKSFSHSSSLSKHRSECKKKNTVPVSEYELAKCHFENEKKIMQTEIDALKLEKEKKQPIDMTGQYISTKRKNINKDVRQYIVDKQENSCGECKLPLTLYFQIDHIVGLQFGGTNEETNLMALCCECHAIKSITENKCRKQIKNAIQAILRENRYITPPLGGS